MGELRQIETLFAIRGNLDGEVEAEFVDREQFIGLKIGGEEFYLPIAIVNEIIMLQSITFVPQCPEFVEGVINLRGTILPVLNLRKMMGLPRAKVTPAVRIIIIRHSTQLLGLIVDGITYVVALLPSEVEEQSLPNRGLGADLISRISKHAEKVKGILDIAKIVNVAGGGQVAEEDTPAAAADSGTEH